jgi:hypothetical protein
MRQIKYCILPHLTQIYRGLGSSCLTLSYRGGQFYLRKPEYLEKTTDMTHVTDKLYHIIGISSTPRQVRDSNSPR